MAAHYDRAVLGSGSAGLVAANAGAQRQDAQDKTLQGLLEKGLGCLRATG